MAIAKVIYKSSPQDSGTVWMDTTQKTVTAGTMLSGVTALKNDGTSIVGTYSPPEYVSVRSEGKVQIKDSDGVEIFESQSQLNGSETMYDNIVSFKPTLSVELEKIKINIKPVQNLNGYENSWVAGSGSNKAYWPTLTNSSSNGVNYTILDDGNTLHVEGTASANSIPWSASLSNTYANMPLGPYPAGTYTIIANGLVGQNTNDRIAFTARYADNTTVSVGSGRITSTTQNGTGAAVTFTATDEFKIGFYMFISSGTSVNCDVKIWLEKASSLGSWEPYENICPITGSTGANIFRTGENLFNEATATIYRRYMSPTSDKWINDSGSCSYAFPCMPDTDYVISASNENLAVFRVGYITESDITSAGEQIYSVTRRTAPGNILVHTGNDATYIIIQCSAAIVSVRNAQIRVAYGKSFTVDWTSSAGTVYGGIFDALAGTLSVTNAFVEFDGVTNGKKMDNTGSLSEYDSYYSVFSGGKVYGTNAWVSKADAESDHACCSVAKYRDETTGINYGFMNGTSGDFQIRFNFPTSANISTLEAANQWLNDLYTAGTPCTVCYPLETPLTYQLTAQSITMLTGYNNVWTDTGGEVDVLLHL